MRLSYPQYFTATALAFFLVVTFTHFGTRDGLSGVSSGIQESLMRGSIKSIMAKSDQLWQKTVRQRHEVFAKFPNMGFFPAYDVPNYFAYPYSVWDLVPASYNCPFEVERIGRMGDGGKWVCGMSRYEKNTKPCIIYSFGIQNESSFEQEMLERTNCEVWGYDFSVTQFGPIIKDNVRHRTHFHPIGIAGNTDLARSPPFTNIQDAMTKNGHDYIDILKIDIEYSEFETLWSLNTHLTTTGQTTMPIGQMLIEIHLFEPANAVTLPTFLEWWEMLESRGFRPAWTEPNLLTVTIKGAGDSQPRLAEYSMINVDNVKNKLLYG